MKLSKSGEYALRALIFLALRYNKNKDAIVKIQEISLGERIPKKFLESILLKLKKAGILKSSRGTGGGYSLNKAPEEITLAQVIRIIDGPLAPLGCASVTAHVYCPEEKNCGLQKVMKDVRNAISGILDHYTLHDVLLRTSIANEDG
ncbi:MAG: hypothetical protein A2Y62_13075 [Candidatus Fischerbacteria bacterium RBG_13_37_8]|uniref:Rrf2 family transcriptional regulator n=1 Tax=Candidatus Fischerbacteria bacterium RBG_13_37_8 TaxID=1817863 RepID=A0A1F5V5L0_9BACT|nr:MAG: hypothetical protein A2Y62_13075 [Candidatus Fischerbacteria bacterium RBG_13_37_8]